MHGDSLLTSGVYPTRAIGWLTPVKGKEHITVFYYRRSFSSMVCGWVCVNFPEFLGISFLHLVATCSCDLGTLYLITTLYSTGSYLDLVLDWH